MGENIRIITDDEMENLKLHASWMDPRLNVAIQDNGSMAFRSSADFRKSLDDEHLRYGVCLSFDRRVIVTASGEPIVGFSDPRLDLTCLEYRPSPDVAAIAINPIRIDIAIMFLNKGVDWVVHRFGDQVREASGKSHVHSIKESDDSKPAIPNAASIKAKLDVMSPKRGERFTEADFDGDPYGKLSEIMPDVDKFRLFNMLRDETDQMVGFAKSKYPLKYYSLSKFEAEAAKYIAESYFFAHEFFDAIVEQGLWRWFLSHRIACAWATVEGLLAAGVESLPLIPEKNDG